MDTQLSKGLAKEFMRKAGIISEERFDELSETLNSNEKSLNKRFEKIRKNFNSEKNNYAIHQAEFGSKANPGIGLTYLTKSDYNQAMKRNEPIINGQQHFIFKNPPKFIASPGILFTIGQHLIQRLIERNPEINSFNYDLIFDIIRKELKFVTLYSSIIRYFLSFAAQKAGIPNKVIHGEVPLRFPIPSENGMFGAHIFNGVPFLRTFKSVNEMNKKEIELRTKMIELTEQYCSINFPYYFESAIQLESKSSNSQVKFYQALFFLSIIFIDFRGIFKLIIPDALGDILPDGQKREVIEKIIDCLETFPTDGDSTELRGYNSALREAIKDKKSLEYFRKLTIFLTKAFQKKSNFSHGFERLYQS